MNNYVLIWGDWLSCDPLRGSHDSQSPHIWGRTHCHLCPTRYSFLPESSEAFEGVVSCPRTQHLDNISRLSGEKHDNSLKILHQAGFKTARQAATSAERHALTIAPCPSLMKRKVLTKTFMVISNLFIYKHFSALTVEGLICLYVTLCHQTPIHHQLKVMFNTVKQIHLINFLFNQVACNSDSLETSEL